MKQLTPITVNAPGSLGLNKKLERLDIGAQWCVEAENAVIDESGVLGSRKGWEPVSAAISGSPDPKAIFEYIDSTNTSRILTAAGNKIYEGTGTLTDVTGALVPTADNWKFVNFNGKVIGVQAGHNPIVKTLGGNFTEINFNGGTVSQPYEALSSWGRVWYVDKDGQTIYWSDLLIEGAVIGSTTPGSSGTLNLETVWGGDKIVALAAFNNFLVIFGRRHIVLYKGVEDPNTSLGIADIIYGSGCIARDSVQNTGNDILFLGAEGVTSISRNLQDGSLPLNNLSENVRDFLDLYVSSEPVDGIKSVYQPEIGLYLLSLPYNDQVFAFSFKYRTQEGLPRITNWRAIKPTAFLAARDGTLYLGKPGYLARYHGNRDNGSSYEMTVRTGWFVGSGQMSTVTKIPKQALLTVKGGWGTSLTMEWGYDYTLAIDATQQELIFNTTPAMYGNAEYGINEYSGTSEVTNLNFRMSGTGRAIQYTFKCTIDGAPLLIQRSDVFVKIGRTI